LGFESDETFRTSPMAAMTPSSEAPTTRRRAYSMVPH